MRMARWLSAALITAVLTFYSVGLWSQNVNHSESFVLNSTLNGLQSHEYFASDYIDLNEGFYNNPGGQNHTVLALDPYSVYPPVAGVLGGPHAADTGVVGSIGGTVDISASGGALYSIPVVLPVDIGDVYPNLTISYNSQAGNGLLGWGWGLNGVSAITRVCHSLYYDGDMKGVDFVDDRYALDGKRLMLVNNKEYGQNGAEYRTEVDDMTKVISYRNNNDTTYGPACFKVWTADGFIMEFGNTWDSRIGLNQPHDVCVWLLNRVEDRYGNYMTYHYYKGTSEYRLSRIEYTGNVALSIVPNYSVNFLYDSEYRCDEESLFIGNNLLKNNKLLRSIVISYQNEEIARYDFDFFNAANNTHYSYYRLKTVSYSCDGVSYNPTVINWPNDDAGSVPTFPYYYGRHVIVDGDPQSDAFKTKFKFTGDFNGDGFTDIIAIENVDLIRDSHSVDSCRAHIYLNIGRDNVNQQSGVSFEYLQTIELTEYANWIYVADLNNDGKDDFVIVDREPGTYYDKLFIKPYLTYVTTEGLQCLQAYSDLDSRGYAIGGTHGENLLIGDFLGRGRNDIVLQIPRDKLLGVTIVKPKLLYITYEGNAHFSHEYLEETVLPGKKFTAADFNGDGVPEIWCSNDGYITENMENESDRANAVLMKMSTMTSACQFGNGQMLSSWHQLFPGDFNGDGKTDLLTYVPVGKGGTWQVNLFKGNSLFWSQYDITDTIPIDDPGNHTYSMRTSVPNYRYIEVGDFNGDGKSDLAVSTGPDNTNEMYVFFGPLHRYGDNSLCKAAFSGRVKYTMLQIGLNSTDNRTICTGNFQGENNLSMISDKYYFMLPSMTNRYSVSSITDGMGNRSSFDYDYLMAVSGSHGFYNLDPSFSDKDKNVFVMSLPVKAVCTLTTGNTIANTTPVVTKYSYKSALVHRYGRGLIGFAQVNKELLIGNVAQKRTVSVFNTQVMGSHCAAVLESVMTVLPGSEAKMLSKTLYENTFMEHQHNGKVFIPIVVRQQDFDYSLDNDWVLTKTITENEYQIDGYHDTVACYQQALKLTDVNQGITRQGNVQHVVDCEFQSVKHTEYYSETQSNYENWVINRPLSTLFKAQRLDDPVISQSLVAYKYCNNTVYHPDTILTYPGADLTNENGLATYTRLVYDNAGNVIEETLGTVDGSLPERPSYYTYDLYRFKVSEENALGYTKGYEYYPKYGDLQSETDINGMVTIVGRDNALGTTRWVEKPDGTKKYTAKRWVNCENAFVDGTPSDALYYVWEKESGGKPVRTFFDAADRELRTISYGIGQRAVYQDIEYNSLGLVGRKSLPYFDGDTILWTVFHYDMYHRPDTTFYPDGTMVVQTYDDLHTWSKLCPSQGSGLSPQITMKSLDAAKNIKYSIDASNTKIGYDYYADGKLKSTMIDNHENTRVVMQYDAAGNRTDLYDPNYGHSQSVYNAYHELVMSITPKQDTTIYVYDILGRNISSVEIGHSDTTLSLNNRFYYEMNGKLGLLRKEERTDGDGTHSVVYTYDTLLRVDTIIETINGISYSSTFVYDELSRIQSKTYPTGVRVLNKYQNNILKTITDEGGNLLWTTLDANASGQITKYKTGNGVTVLNDFNLSTGRLVAQSAVSLETVNQNYEYEYDDFGNLKWRKDGRYGQDGLVESFGYDPLNRLTHIQLNHSLSSNIQYDSQGMGRMLHKEADGSVVFTAAQYSDNIGDKPHAMQSATVMGNPFPTNSLNVAYTMFDQPKKLEQEDKKLYYSYGFDHQRLSMRLENNGILVMTKTYVGLCEYIWTQSGNKDLTFINGPAGVFAVVERVGSNSDMHYVYKDHLGSWTTITDENGAVEQRLSFDAWGNLRNPNTWTGNYTDTPMFDRGFTGHEHLTDFGLINMNGRMYDPVMSSFLSPDNYMQCPDNSQNFNRYAYCMNNPLRYTDPSGEIFGLDDVASLAIMVGVSVTVAVTQNGVCNTLHGRPFFQNAGQVALMATLQSGCSAFVGGVAGSMGPGAFLFQAGAHAALNGYFACAQGGDFRKGAMAGLVSSLFSTLTTVSAAGMDDTWRQVAIIASGTLSGGVTTKMMGGDFIDGAIDGFIIAGLNHALHQILDRVTYYKLKNLQNYRHHRQTSLKGCKIALARSYYQYFSGEDLGDAFFSTIINSMIDIDHNVTLKKCFEECRFEVQDGMGVDIMQIGDHLTEGHLFSVVLKGERLTNMSDIDHLVTLFEVFRENGGVLKVSVYDPLCATVQHYEWKELMVDIKDAYFITGLKQR